MGRPTLSEAKKRKAVSISLKKEVLALAESTGNKSQFFERSVEACTGIRELMAALKAGEASRADVLEEIEDIVDAWDALRDELVPLPKPKKKRA